ncbi:TRAP-type C4-dicarboxylate transport system, small permease component [Halobacillus karajensis]|uniref:2,3-diketo-L-gulonate TRAP transporter small permease protein YiaM n=1 Tax=Halobacillus karajensis TaxID=195088 RepID=A0A059NVD4_9BACI|nr:TRAP transporter small permease [Halobacillus karajensis]CDQ18892.1 2,3-diketo-L-gulonate TRAP transporter small permease protein YiaM [Halobacillus karajensis]CDQ23035.1 2,3-diketo-L-gulonate TRAP transporter small permease protein YiaM [Halobacillus karajensis]CDQ26517.1 2,3-diketo-L-gulonate TRAP transporter small permease protein YiaM [Halobacillus karajensis]SEH44705.1 TRAP-type C4-dicarboxylate transport system, small permease component [Halobacillus karajensis]
MNIIRAIDRRLEEVLLVIFSTTMVSVIFLQVAMRVSGNSLSWSEELGRYCFIWLVYIGISYGVKKQRHIKVDVMLLLLKGKAKLMLAIISNLLFLVFSLYVVFNGYDIASQLLSFGQKSPALHIPMGWVYMATPVGFALTAIRLIQNLFVQFRMLFGKKELHVEDERDRMQKQEGEDES